MSAKDDFKACYGLMRGRIAYSKSDEELLESIEKRNSRVLLAAETALGGPVSMDPLNPLNMPLLRKKQLTVSDEQYQANCNTNP
ncbi:MAG: hypothetical protein P4M13_03190 [Alphaproteobacteria bacterium]|nr:hypothetical protein [Alphaproteobacteria bacterium]